MAIHKILVYGDQRLVASNGDVNTFDDDLGKLIEDMFETGANAPGLGLAAPQIGVNLRLAVIDLSVGKDPSERLVLANPEIIEQTGSTVLDEGCLSFPGLYTTIKRPKRILVTAQDENGEAYELEATELLAQAICHEVDHLDSVLIIDQLRGLKRQLFRRKIKKKRETGEWC